jgi:hypothetical protein
VRARNHKLIFASFFLRISLDGSGIGSQIKTSYLLHKSLIKKGIYLLIGSVRDESAKVVLVISVSKGNDR